MRKKTSNENCEQMAYRFYGIPSEHDAAQEDKTFGCCRYLWNRMLGDHNTLYSEIGEVPANTPADYKDLDECSWLNGGFSCTGKCTVKSGFRIQPLFQKDCPLSELQIQKIRKEVLYNKRSLFKEKGWQHLL